MIENYKSSIQKWLKNSEEIDYELSRCHEGYCVIRIMENGAFWLGGEGSRKGRFIFAKETSKGLQYLYDSLKLYADWDKVQRDFRSLSALDKNIFLHLIVSLVDDKASAIFGAMIIEVQDVLSKYVSLASNPRGEDCRKMMQECAGFFSYPYFCYLNFNFFYKARNMAFEAGITKEMMGRLS